MAHAVFHGGLEVTQLRAAVEAPARQAHGEHALVGAVLVIAAVQLAALAVMGDILAGMRSLQQRTLERVRRVELQLGVEPSHYEPGAPKRADPGVERTTGADAGPATGKPDRETVEL